MMTDNDYRPIIKQDADSWLAGYRAGLWGDKSPPPPVDVDLLSFYSGKIEADAHLKHPPPVTLENDGELSGKGFHWLAGAFSVASALELLVTDMPKIKPSAVVLQKVFDSDGETSFQIWSPSP